MCGDLCWKYGTKIIGGITNATRDWTCKVQIVDISRERQSLEKKLRFQNLILEDEEEQQVRAVVYADDIDQYADKLVMLRTYLISTARVKALSALYGRPIHTFYWILDTETALEEVKPTDEIEKPLPPPTRLHIIAFDNVARLTPGPAMEIDILGAVLHCGPLKYAGRTQNKCREIIVGDEQKNQFMLTLWDDFGEIEETELEATMEGGKKFPVILARNIGVSSYQGFSLQTRFNSTIRINPAYPQALALINWAKSNKDMLASNAPSNFAGSSAAVTVNPAQHPIIRIAEITSTASVGVLYIEGAMSIADDLQDFCVLECSGCKQKKRTKERKQFDCPKCQRKTTLVPRCTFQVDLIDSSGSTTASISGDLAEKLLAMTAEDIYDTTCVKHKLLSLDSVQEMLSNKLFHVQVGKSLWKSSNSVAQTSLAIVSYSEKKDVSPPIIGKRNRDEVEMKVVEAESGTLSSGPLLEPPTPVKK